MSHLENRDVMDEAVDSGDDGCFHGESEAVVTLPLGGGGRTRGRRLASTSRRTWCYFPVDLWPHRALSNVQIVTGLQIDPELRCCPEIAGQS